MRTTLRRTGGLLGLLALLHSSAQAGQVRVDVGGAGGAMIFTPSTVTLNPGDHVVFVWKGASHSVTSGDSVLCEADNLYFDSGTVATNTQRGTTFTWKSPNSAIPNLSYICTPHCPTMKGRLRVLDGNPVADFRITEVQTNLALGHDLIEITNFGNASGDLGRYRIVATGDTAMVPTNDWVVPAGGRVVLNVNQSGAQGPPSNMFLPTLTPTATGLADNSGFVALYAPNTVVNSLVDASQIVDFVQYGAAGSSSEGTAVSAGLWTAGTFIPTVAAARSMEFCGAAASHGVTFWSEVAVPNFGSAGNCTTPSRPMAWGRLKMLYR